MLKKVIIGISVFIFVAIAGAAAYIYTLDWNKHKTQVSQKLTQITGLKSQINGNLKVEFFPMPKITAGRVSFFSNTGSTPLIEISEITANLELKPLLNNNFIVKSMILTQPTAYININERGELNWKNVGKNSNNKSGNVEMSFNDIKLNSATLTYKNKQNRQEFSIPNITASVSAPTLAGPYKTNGKFIHNNSEIKFDGTILNNAGLKVKMSVSNAATGSKFEIDGDAGAQAKGNLTFDTRSLADIGDIIFGDKTFSQNYREPLYVSFQYGYNGNTAKLDNFNFKYGRNNIGNGSVFLKSDGDNKEAAANFNMTQFDLSLLEQLSRDYINFAKMDDKYGLAEKLQKYAASLNLKSAQTTYNESAVQNLSMELALKDGILGLTRFSALFPGETSLKTAGKINLNDKALPFIFNQAVESRDLRTFASIFGLDLGKMATEDNKKSIFKNAKAELKLNGDLNSLTITVPGATIDSTDLSGSAGFIFNEDTLFVLADINASKIIFDRYLQALPETMKTATYKEKFIHQMNLIPWNKNINLEADIAIAGAVYSKIPMEKINLQFVSQDDKLDVKKLSFGNIAGAQLNTQFTAEKIYTEPTFSNLLYDVKTSNFPYFASTMGIDTGSMTLFKRKVFASQGNLTGTFNEFNLSSVQKFGETEFSFTGAAANPDKQPISINGDLEFKTNNALNFIKALDFDYSPEIPVTSLTASGKIKGTYNLFEYLDINAFLGANNIKGYIQLDNRGEKPVLKSEMSFDKFDADHWFNIEKKNTRQKQKETSSFIALPSFSEEAYNYTALTKVNFDIKAKADALIYGGKAYNETQIEAKLKDGSLNIASFDTRSNTNDIGLSFILNTGNLPTINGKYEISGIKTPALGGRTYLLDSGILKAEGTFNSSAYSEKEFLENLNSEGKFQLQNTAMNGWDLDIIKFDLEQRKQTAGFEELVLSNLKTGRSAFNKISGSYKINKGVIIADKVIWESPVANMNMQLNLNLSDKLFTAVFGAVYHNASFSDIINFTMKGYLAEPSLEVDLSDSLKRIGGIEELANKAKENQFKEKREKLSDRINGAQIEIQSILKEISRITANAVQYKPLTNDRQIAQIYDNNMNVLRETESNLEKMADILSVSADEKDIMDIESQINVEKSKLRFIPKTFEENFVTDSKNAFDETLNKITWLYNAATNNTAYYNELTDVFIKQIETLKNAGKKFAEDAEEPLIKGINKVSKDMEKINKLHAKTREDYLFILDTTNASAIQDSNVAAVDSLRQIAVYINQLNADIVDNLQAFRKMLEMKARNDKDYLIYPPENVEDIDVSKPATKTPTKDKIADEAAEKPEVTETEQEAMTDTSADTEILPDTVAAQPVSKEEKKNDETNSLIETLTSFQNITNGIGAFVKNLTNSTSNDTNTVLVAEINSGGLAGILHQNTAAELTASSSDSTVEPAVNENEKPASTALQDITVAEAKISDAKHIEISEPILNEQMPVAQETIEQDGVSPSEAEKKETNIKLNPKTIRIASEKASVISDVVNKTQTALNDILLTIKQAEQKLQDEIEIAKAVEKDAPEKLIDIAKYTVPVEMSDSSKLKRNPVIAMNIGKELAPVQDINAAFISKAFKTKKKQFNSVLTSLPAETAAPDAALRNTAHSEITAKTEIPTFDIFDVVYQPTIKSIEAKAADLKENQNKYLFVSGKPVTRTTGLTGKSAVHQIYAKTSEPTSLPRYLFAANDINLSPAHGIIGKKASLSVK